MTAVLSAPGNGRAAGAVTAAAVGAAACGLSFHPAVAGDRLPVLVAVAAVTPALLAFVLGRFLHRPLWTDVILSMAVWWLAAAVLVPWPGGVASSLGRPGAALGQGFGPLLEWVPPAPERSELLIVPLFLTWLAATAGAELALRGTAGPVAALPAWCTWALAVTFAVPGAGSHVATAAVLLAVTVWLARPHGGAPVGMAVVGILLAGAGIAAAAAYGGADAHDIRSAFPADAVPDDVLADYDRWRANPAEALFDVIGPALPAGDPGWRLAELVTPDHDRWVTSTSFRRTDPRGGAGPDDRTVAVTGLRSAFLPTLGALAETGDGGGVWTAAGTSMVVRADRDKPVSYAVRPAPVAGHPSAPDAAVPAGCESVAAQLLRTAAGPDRRTENAAGAVTAAYRLATVLGPAGTTPAGGAAGRAAPYGCSSLTLAVRDRRATEVQRALAYVLLVRAAGTPARIAVGFTDAATASRRTITGADARVWPEVWVGGRWVAVTVPAAGPVVPPAPPPPPGDDAAGPSPPASGVFDADPRRVLPMVLLALLLVGLAVLGGRLLRRWTNRSIARAARRQGTPAERIAAAWRDAVGELSRAGPEVPAGATPREVVAGATGLAPEAADALHSLAGDVIDVLYGGAEADDERVAVAWRRRDDVAGAVRRGTSERGGRRSLRTRTGTR